MRDITKEIEHYGLLVRPSLVGGFWVSKWKGVTGDNKAYCMGEIGEGRTIKEAIDDWKEKTLNA